VNRADWIAGVRAKLADLERMLDAPPDGARSDTDRPPPDSEPTIEQERHAIADAWTTLHRPEGDEALDDGTLIATLFASVACVYEGAEAAPPVMGVLMAIRDTVRGWSHARGGDTLFARVSFADLALMVRRVDVAMALVKSDDRRRGGEP
jgi:hypothetical protein